MKYHLINLVTGEILIYHSSYEECQERIFEYWGKGQKIPFLITPSTIEEVKNQTAKELFGFGSDEV